MFDLIGKVSKTLENIEADNKFEASRNPSSIADNIESSLAKGPHKVAQGKPYEIGTANETIDILLMIIGI